MKFFTALCITVVAAMGVVSAVQDATEAGAASGKVTVHIRARNGPHQRVAHHAAEKSTSKTRHHHATRMTTKTFAHLAHFKSTPWDAEPEVKATKCDDLCDLFGFYSFQQARNCEIRPTDLCMQFKLGKVAMETVLVTAECSCDDAEAASGSDEATDAASHASA